MKLLVTGGAGFIGSNFIRFWMEGHPEDEVVNLDLLTYAGDPATVADIARLYWERYRFAQGDIADPGFVLDLFEEVKPETVVNFAAESHNSRAVKDPGIFVRTNVVGTQILLDAAYRIGVQRFHHISTCEVYGDLALDSPVMFTEQSPYRPRTPYNASKAAADHLVRAYGDTFKLPVTITNCSNNFGPWQFPEKAVPKFVTCAVDDLPLPIYRHSENRREWLHVLDHCRAIELVLLRGIPGETYNVGSGVEKSVEEVADAILDLLGKPHDLKTYVEDRPGHDRRYLLDHDKITRDLGWVPKISFDEGLRDVVTWYRGNRSWWEPKREALKTQLDESSWKAAGR